MFCSGPGVVRPRAIAGRSVLDGYSVIAQRDILEGPVEISAVFGDRAVLQRPVHAPMPCVAARAARTETTQHAKGDDPSQQ